MEMKKLHGIVTAMVTPIGKNGDILMPSVDALVEKLIQAGIHGLYPLGSTGEMLLLDQQKRKVMAERVVETAAGRVPVFIHIAAPTTQEAVALAHHAADIGADGIAAVTPMYYTVSDEEMTEYYAAIARSVPEDFPIYLYNLPQSTVNDLSVDVCSHLARAHSNIIGIKYSYPDLLRTRKYIEVNGGNFSVLQGCDLLVDAALVLGCDGIVSGLSNSFPEVFVQAYDAVCAGDENAVRAAMKKVCSVGEILLDGGGMANMKAALALQGIDMGEMVAPLLPTSPEKMHEMQSRLIEAGLLA